MIKSFCILSVAYNYWKITVSVGLVQFSARARSKEGKQERNLLTNNVRIKEIMRSIT